MRVVAGRLKGRAILAPEGRATRPTSDRVREAVFNVLAHRDLEGFELDGARVLDLFAGSGAMGIEAISRGAAFCLFVEEAIEPRAAIRANVEAMGLTGVTKIWKRDAARLDAMPPNANGPFDLVILDPPYRQGLVERALAGARDGGWIADGAVIVAEQAADEATLSVDGFSVADARAYGETRATFLVRRGA